MKLDIDVDNKLIRIKPGQQICVLSLIEFLENTDMCGDGWMFDTREDTGSELSEGAPSGEGLLRDGIFTQPMPGRK